MIFLVPHKNLQRSDEVPSQGSRCSDRNISRNRSTALQKHKLYPTYKRGDNNQNPFLLKDMKNKTVKIQKSEVTRVSLRNNERCLNLRGKGADDAVL